MKPKISTLEAEKTKQRNRIVRIVETLQNSDILVRRLFKAELSREVTKGSTTIDSAKIPNSSQYHKDQNVIVKINGGNSEGGGEMNDRLFLPEGNGKAVEVYLSEDKHGHLLMNVKRFEEYGTTVYIFPIGKVSPPASPKTKPMVK